MRKNETIKRTVKVVRRRIPAKGREKVSDAVGRRSMTRRTEEDYEHGDGDHRENEEQEGDECNDEYRHSAVIQC